MRVLLTISLVILSLARLYGSDSVAPCKFEVELTGVDVKCNGDFTGQATVNIIQVGGASGPYEIQWFDGNTSAFRDDLPAGTHFVKVTDALGCFLNEFIDLEEPDELVVDLQLNDVLCFGEATGSIDLDIQGGSPPYLYQWSNGETTQNINTLIKNSYTVTVTDANQCVVVETGEISQPVALGISPSVLQVSCPGGNDGQIKTVTFGGVLPYRYLWSTLDTIPNIINLSSGNYTLTITDGNNCQLSETYFVPQPPEIEISFQVTDLSCFEEPDGSILATVIGGTEGYRYEWSNSGFVLGDTTNNPQGLVSDFYKLRIIDANNCLKIDSVFVDQPSPLVVNLEATDATCFASSNGFVDMTVSGGREPYSILWSTTSQQQDIDQLISDFYSVVVADKTGCTQFAEIFVGQPDSLDFQVEVAEVTCKDQVDGMITIDPVGGTPDYSVQWDNGATDFHLEELPGSTYSVILTDGQDCTYNGSFEVLINPKACVELVTIPKAFSPNGDGINDIWRIKNHEVYPNMQVEVYSRWGKSFFRSVGYQEPWDGRFLGKEAPTDTYYYIVDLKNGDRPFNGSLTLVR